MTVLVRYDASTTSSNALHAFVRTKSLRSVLVPHPLPSKNKPWRSRKRAVAVELPRLTHGLQRRYPSGWVPLLYPESQLRAFDCGLKLRCACFSSRSQLLWSRLEHGIKHENLPELWILPEACFRLLGKHPLEIMTFRAYPPEYKGARCLLRDVFHLH